MCPNRAKMYGGKSGFGGGVERAKAREYWAKTRNAPAERNSEGAVLRMEEWWRTSALGAVFAACSGIPLNHSAARDCTFKSELHSISKLGRNPNIPSIAQPVPFIGAAFPHSTPLFLHVRSWRSWRQSFGIAKREWRVPREGNPPELRTVSVSCSRRR